MSNIFPIENSLKRGDALSPFLFNLASEYAIRSVKLSQKYLKFCGTHRRLFYADDINILGGSVPIIKKIIEALIVASKENVLEVISEKTGYVVVCREQNAEQNNNIMTHNKSFERVEQSRYLATILTNQNSVQEEIKSRLKSGNACYYAVQNLFSSNLLSKI